MRFKALISAASRRGEIMTIAMHAVINHDLSIFLLIWHSAARRSSIERCRKPPEYGIIIYLRTCQK